MAAAKKENDVKSEPIGSTMFGEDVAVGDQRVPASTILAGALEMSGLSVEEWNALGETEIDKRLNAVLEGMNATWRAARGSSGAVVFDPLNPGKASLRMAQTVMVHRQEGPPDKEGNPTGPHVPYKLNVGMNHDVPAWVVDHPFVRENLDKT